ncbi:bactofilin family protein [Methylocystis parvus]|uniref:Polymer-forming cytoskeletal protein n=1 Tax=Methylocystis parvus TaxID=134 RepID=A0A6B8M2X0_9HYPH|nr:polymer-forming cytoskeletal protein [Methylocystis parvus]QGM96685.1 polymer-forming cytoskeletal protein [Methylocystis parvus]WBJ99449.1 polymer-forming cytoskeletal protein [Methylocystis parvus OBBP]
MATFRNEEANSVYIGEGAELTGVIRARDSVVVDGSFDGEIVCNHLVVGQGGTIKGKVNVANADIAGSVNAEIAAGQLLTVRATGRIEGKWDCGTIEVARGAVLNGSANVAEMAGAARREARSETAAKVGPAVEEEYESPAAVVTALPEPRRLTKLNLRAPRRSVG